jgi:hypothetical protein
LLCLYSGFVVVSRKIANAKSKSHGKGSMLNNGSSFASRQGVQSTPSVDGGAAMHDTHPSTMRHTMEPACAVHADAIVVPPRKGSYKYHTICQKLTVPHAMMKVRIRFKIKRLILTFVSTMKVIGSLVKTQHTVLIRALQTNDKK